MAKTKSAKKALRQNKTRQIRNLTKLNALKKSIKEYRNLVKAKDFKKAQNMLASIYQMLDKNAKTNTIKKNTASRKKSRLTLMLHKAMAK